MDFKLKGEFVELDNLLKILNFVQDGASAKSCIQAQEVKVNGEVEVRVRKKLRLGDCVEFRDQQIKIV